MTIGIVIPCKDYAQFLPDALASIARQNALVSMVVIDDGSQDAQAVRDAAQGVSVIRLDTSRGIGIARNIGAAFLHTDYLLFLDADDTLHAGALAGLLMQLKKSFADFAYGNYTQDGALIETPRWERATLETRNVASYCNLWHRSAFWKIGGYSDVPVAEDWDLQRRAMERGAEGVHAGITVFDHRIHGANKWTRDAVNFGGLAGAREVITKWK